MNTLYTFILISSIILRSDDRLYQHIIMYVVLLKATNVIRVLNMEYKECNVNTHNVSKVLDKITLRLILPAIHILPLLLY